MGLLTIICIILYLYVHASHAPSLGAMIMNKSSTCNLHELLFRNDLLLNFINQCLFCQLDHNQR